MEKEENERRRTNKEREERIRRSDIKRKWTKRGREEKKIETEGRRMKQKLSRWYENLMNIEFMLFLN